MQSSGNLGIEMYLFTPFIRYVDNIGLKSNVYCMSHDRHIEKTGGFALESLSKDLTLDPHWQKDASRVCFGIFHLLL